MVIDECTMILMEELMKRYIFKYYEVITVTVKELANRIETSEFELMLGVFLENFKRSDRKYHLVEDEPRFVTGHNEEMCFLAGAVHKLCNDNGVKCPKWIFKEKYYLDHRVYAYDAKT